MSVTVQQSRNFAEAQVKPGPAKGRSHWSWLENGTGERVVGELTRKQSGPGGKHMNIAGAWRTGPWSAGRMSAKHTFSKGSTAGVPDAERAMAAEFEKAGQLMANRITELVTRLIARDDASKVIEHVADDLDKLEKRPDVEVGVGVEDKTEAGLREIDRRLDGLSAEDKQIVVRAQLRDAQREVDRLARSLKDVDKLDDEEVKIRVEALGNARAELKAIEDQAERLDKEKVDVEVDADTTGIRGKFRQLQTDIATQTTALGKLSTIGSTALSGLATYGPQAAAVAATAVATAVTKMVTDFQTLALEAGKASDALGMSPEDVSRLMEVTDDLGIAWGTVQTAIGRMNRTAETTPDRLEQIGAAIRRSDEGVLDVTGTFQSVVDALDSIPDAGQRAAAGQQIFGKSWAQMAELIEGGADRLVDLDGQGRRRQDRRPRRGRQRPRAARLGRRSRRPDRGVRQHGRLRARLRRSRRPPIVLGVVARRHRRRTSRSSRATSTSRCSTRPSAT